MGNGLLQVGTRYIASAYVKCDFTAIHRLPGILHQLARTRCIASLLVLSSLAAMAEVRLPAIPDSITRPAARADWLTAHFWDDNDLATPGPALEEAFATFASLLPHASPDGRTEAARIFADRAPRDNGRREAISGIVESYLLDRHSPVHDEDAYALLASAMIARGWPGREAMEYLCAMTRMARPGTPAPDLTYTDRGGDVHTLAKTVGTVPTLLLFHSPGCGECEEMIATLRADSDLSRCVAEVKLRILAVAIYAPLEVWMAHEALPAGWLDVHTDTDPADAGYSVPYTPTLYLIDAAGNIILKDAALDEIKSVLPQAICPQ